MLKIIIAIVVILLLLGGGYYFYATTQKTSQTQTLKTSGKVMTVSRNYWPGQYWVDIAHQKGWFKEAGLNVELVDVGKDYFQSLKDTVDGKLSTNNFSLFDVMKFNTEGSDLVMVIYSDYSDGADGIVAKKGIENLRDLKGKKIGVSKETYGEYILDIALGREGVTKDAYTIIDMAPEKAVEGLSGGTVDAVVAYEPFVTESVTKAQGHKVFDTSQITGLSPNGWVFKRSFVQERPDDVQAFVKVWHKTTNYIKQNPEEAFKIIAEVNKVTAGEAQAFTETNVITDLDTNTTAFSYSAGFESLHGIARKINDFLIDRKITNQQLDSTKFLEPKFIRAIQ